jgi:hypothetical protein
MPNKDTRRPAPQRRGALTEEQLDKLNAELHQDFENLNTAKKTEQNKPTGKSLVRSQGASNIDESAASASAASASADSEANHGGAEVGGAEAFTGNTKTEEIWQKRIARGSQGKERRGAIAVGLAFQGLDWTAVAESTNEHAAKQPTDAAQSSAAAGHGGGGGGGEAPKRRPIDDPNFVSNRAKRADAARRTHPKSMDQSSLGATISSARDESSSIQDPIQGPIPGHKRSQSENSYHQPRLWTRKLEPIAGKTTNQEPLRK